MILTINLLTFIKYIIFIIELDLKISILKLYNKDDKMHELLTRITHLASKPNVFEYLLFSTMRLTLL
jgi:hypothetical protein